jgi:hypothetical protein
MKTLIEKRTHQSFMRRGPVLVVYVEARETDVRQTLGFIEIFITGLIGGCLLAPTLAYGHDVTVDQVVEMTVRPLGNRLLVRLHVPATVLGEAKLPRLDDGRLDPAAVDRLLPVVAADTARNLDLRQDDVSLGSPVAMATLGADHVSVDVELEYALDARPNRLRQGSGGQDGSRHISARLNAFQGTQLQPPRTDARYLPASGEAQNISVTGAPRRVTFDPGPIETVRQFAAGALGAVLGAGDHLLFLVCLLLPVRRAREASRLVAAAIGAQALGTMLGGPGGAWLSAAAMIAASFITVAALQNVIGGGWRWTMGLAVGFGILNGFAFGDAFLSARQLAGSHQTIACIIFLSVVAIAQLWLGAVIWATRRWLDDVGAPGRIVTVLGSVIVAHEAVHRIAGRGQTLAEIGSVSADHALLWLTLAWGLVMLTAAAIEALRRHRRHDLALAKTSS